MNDDYEDGYSAGWDAAEKSMQAEIARLQAELAAAYAELRKQRPALTAVFDREVHNRAAKAGQKEPPSE